MSPRSISSSASVELVSSPNVGSLVILRFPPSMMPPPKPIPRRGDRMHKNPLPGMRMTCKLASQPYNEMAPGMADLNSAYLVDRSNYTPPDAFSRSYTDLNSLSGNLALGVHDFTSPIWSALLSSYDLYAVNPVAAVALPTTAFST